MACAPPALRSTTEGDTQFHDSQPDEHFKVSFGNQTLVVTLRGNQIRVDSGASTTFEISNHARHILLVMHFHAHYFTRHVASSYAQ